MAIYHKVVWNFNEVPREVAEAGQSLEQLLQRYIASGSTALNDTYWDPPIFEHIPIVGLRTKYRRWNNYEACQQFVNELNQWRLEDTYRTNIVSEAVICQDDSYQQSA